MKSSTGGNAGSAPRPGAGRAGDLRVRFLSALVLGPAALAAVWAGGWVFLAFVAVGAVLAIHEWEAMVEHERPRPVRAVSTLSVLLVLAAHATLGILAAVAAALALGLVVALMAGHADRWLAALGVPYVALGAVSLVWLREDPKAGLSLILFVLLTVWACDIGAYAAGRAIGGPKLAPRISPKKTWAGLVGGVASAGLVGLGVALTARAADVSDAVLIGAAVALVSQGGDLFESAIKRRYNVKDSGHLIPGHGGLLDRIDGLLVAAPVLALFHATLGTSLAWW